MTNKNKAVMAATLTTLATQLKGGRPIMWDDIDCRVFNKEWLDQAVEIINKMSEAILNDITEEPNDSGL